MKKKILIGLSIILGIIFIYFIVHIFMINNEYSYLKDNKYINLVDSGTYKLNVYRYGNKDSKHKIVGISGMDINDFSVKMKYSLDGLNNDNEIIFIDRAGYGYSNDTFKKQTIEVVVDSYRNALINDNIKAPYILMAHSLGGIYAAYWESKYPGEIEKVIFIDTTEIGKNVWEKDDYQVNLIDYFGVSYSKLGLQRFNLHKTYYELSDMYSNKDKKISDYLNINSYYTNAKLSEKKELNNNTNKVHKNIKKNDIPKLYISSSNGFTTKDELREYNKWLINRQKEVGIYVESSDNPTDEQLEKGLQRFRKWREDRIKPYLDKLGNTKLVLLPGDHMIFEQKPKELNKIIKDFITTSN